MASWNDGDAKRSIIEFVEAVTDQKGPDYVPAADRIAVFDNDGTLWCEQPLYIQLAFAFDRVKALAAEHPEWRAKQPFKGVLDGDLQALGAAGVKRILEFVAATHSGMTTDEFERIAKDWFATAKHPRFDRPYTDLAYQPMAELLAYLRANAFKTYIVSGGGIEFMRAVAERLYGIPPEQVIGSSGKTRYELRDGVPTIVRLPELDFFDDKDGKPVAIQKFIGRRPLAAFGNSDGDQQMLQWTAAGAGRRLAVLIDHTDAEREFEYRISSMGRLELALAEAHERGWTVVSMKEDWKDLRRGNEMKAGTLPFSGVLGVMALAMSAAARGQSDVALFRNGDRLTGEIKALDGGRVSFDTPTTGVINLEWDDIAQLFSTTTFEVKLESGERIYGTLAETTGDGQVRVQTAAGTMDLPTQTVVRMTPIKSTAGRSHRDAHRSRP